MTLTLSSTQAKFNFPRYVPVGLAIYGAGTTVLVADSSHVLIQYSDPTILIDLVYGTHFYAPSTNYYTVDYVFNLAASHFTVSGIEVDGVVQAGWIYYNTEVRPRIWYQVAPFDPVAHLIPLPPVTSPWYTPPV